MTIQQEAYCVASASLLQDLAAKASCKGEILTLLGLMTFADANGMAWPSQSTLAKRTRLPLRSIQRAMARLEASGMIEKTGETAGRSVVKWRVLVAQQSTPCVAEVVAPPTPPAAEVERQTPPSTAEVNGSPTPPAAGVIEQPTPPTAEVGESAAQPPPPTAEVETDLRHPRRSTYAAHGGSTYAAHGVHNYTNGTKPGTTPIESTRYSQSELGPADAGGVDSLRAAGENQSDTEPPPQSLVERLLGNPRWMTKKRTPEQRRRDTEALVSTYASRHGVESAELWLDLAESSSVFKNPLGMVYAMLSIYGKPEAKPIRPNGKMRVLCSAVLKGAREAAFKTLQLWGTYDREALHAALQADFVEGLETIAQDAECSQILQAITSQAIVTDPPAEIRVDFYDVLSCLQALPGFLESKTKEPDHYEAERKRQGRIEGAARGWYQRRPLDAQKVSATAVELATAAKVNDWPMGLLLAAVEWLSVNQQPRGPLEEALVAGDFAAASAALAPVSAAGGGL